MFNSVVAVKRKNMRIKFTIIAILLTGAVSAQIVEPVPFDKKWHIGAGAIAGIWGTLAGNSLELAPEESALFGVAASVAAGVGKELWDVSWCILGDKSATFDTMDIAATTLGGMIGTGLSYVALKIFKKPPVIYSVVNDKSIQVGVKIKL